MTSDSARQTLKRVVEDAVNAATHGPLSGRKFVVDHVEKMGAQQLRIWSTLHFYSRGEPYCCGEPSCHLGLHISERRAVVVDWIRRAMNLRKAPEVEFVETDAFYHSEVIFTGR